MNKLTAIEKKTLDVIARYHFTFMGDSHFRTYRQAKITLNRLERHGLVKREEHDNNMFVLTPLGQDAVKYPTIPLSERGTSHDST